MCSKLSHPNVAPFIGINPTPNHPFSLIFDTAGYLGLREYLDKDPKADKLKLVGHFPSRTRLWPCLSSVSAPDQGYCPWVETRARPGDRSRSSLFRETVTNFTLPKSSRTHISAAKYFGWPKWDPLHHRLRIVLHPLPPGSVVRRGRCGLPPRHCS